MVAFFKEKWKDILVATIAGLLVVVLPKLFNKIWGTSPNLLTIQIVAIVVIVSVMVFVCFILNRNGSSEAERHLNEENEKLKEQIQMYSELGIVKMLPSTIEGEGSTTSILREVDKSFYFMGIAGTKWIKKADNFEETMRKLTATHGSKVRFIILNPMSVAARNMSLADKKDKNYHRDLIISNLRELKKIKEELHLNLDVKMYSHMPIFRIAIVDEEKIYFGQYRINDGGENLSQIVLQGKDKMLYRELSEYYEVAWDNVDLKWFDLSRIDDTQYLDTLKDYGGLQ